VRFVAVRTKRAPPSGRGNSRPASHVPMEPSSRWSFIGYLRGERGASIHREGRELLHTSGAPQTRSLRYRLEVCGTGAKTAAVGSDLIGRGELVDDRTVRARIEYSSGRTVTVQSVECWVSLVSAAWRNVDFPGFVGARLVEVVDDQGRLNGPF